MGTASDVLKTFKKDCFKGKNKKVFIMIRDVRKDVLDLKKKKEGKSGNIQIRVHTNDDKAPPWYVHGYAIPLNNLGLDKPLKKRKMLDKLNNVDGIIDKETDTLLRKIIQSYGRIQYGGSRNKLKYKTEHFKKQKDFFKVKMKSL
ncbi:MAG: hypothetical protein GF364_02280 [Candidatus Lokiarchaeota archaeon]|nr:hypothetical protein [Candidatus Lokiarchaeota archaeon]